MADLKLGGAQAERVPRLFHDNGDGTWSETVAGGAGGGGGGAATIADGSDVAEGAVGDAAAVAGSTGSLSGKLRALSRDTGALTETVPATDTASSGLNGRLQRIAQRLTSLIALLPASLGTKTAANSLPVTLASDGQFIVTTGEVQASPTANTVLGRLKDLLSLIVLAAGEAFIGQVGAPTALVTATPTMSVGGAGANGNYVGPTTTPDSFAAVSRLSGGRAIIKSITITDKLTTAAVAMELWLFSATVVVPTDRSAWTIVDADALLCVGVIAIETSRWTASAANKVYTDDRLGLIVKPAVTSLFYALVVRGTSPAWATGDLQVSLGVLQT